MIYRIFYILIICSLLISSVYLFIKSQEKPDITSPLILNGNAFPIITPTPTPLPTPTPQPTPTPTPLPTPTPQSLTSSDLESLFTKYSNLYSVDINLLRKIAACESGYRYNAANGDYLGMFQFSSGAWINSRSLMGEDSSLGLRTNAEESIKTAAFKISRGEVSAWPNCSR